MLAHLDREGEAQGGQDCTLTLVPTSLAEVDAGMSRPVQKQRHGVPHIICFSSVHWRGPGPTGLRQLPQSPRQGLLQHAW